MTEATDMAGKLRTTNRAKVKAQRTKAANTPSSDIPRQPPGWEQVQSPWVSARRDHRLRVADADPTTTGGFTSSTSSSTGTSPSGTTGTSGSPSPDGAPGHHRHAAPAVAADSTPTTAGSTPSFHHQSNTSPPTTTTSVPDSLAATPAPRDSARPTPGPGRFSDAPAPAAPPQRAHFTPMR